LPHCGSGNPPGSGRTFPDALQADHSGNTRAFGALPVGICTRRACRVLPGRESGKFERARRLTLNPDPTRGHIPRSNGDARSNPAERPVPAATILTAERLGPTLAP